MKKCQTINLIFCIYYIYLWNIFFMQKKASFSKVIFCHSETFGSFLFTIWSFTIYKNFLECFICHIPFQHWKDAYTCCLKIEIEIEKNEFNKLKGVNAGHEFSRFQFNNGTSKDHKWYVFDNNPYSIKLSCFS